MKYGVIEDSTIENCVQLKSTADSDNSPLVQVLEDERFNSFSVFIKTGSPLGRCVGTYDSKLNAIKCACRK